MKIKIFMILMMMAVMLSSALAVDENIEYPFTSSTSYYDSADGSPMNGLIRDNVGLTDKIRLASLTGGSLTMIDGALCSTFADREMSYSPSSSTITQACYTNTQHHGVAWQMYETKSTGWDFLGEKQLSQDEKGCFNVQFGKEYMMTWYYCDEFSKTCTDFESTQSCNIESNGGPWTVRERTCEENGVITNEKVTVNWWDANAPQSCNVNSGTTTGGGTNVGGGSTGDTGDGTSGDGTNGQLYACAGVWDSIAFPTNVRPGEEFAGVGKFTPSVDGKCILSASMNEDPKATLQIANAEGSACGQPDPYYAEKLVDVQAGQTIDVNFLSIKSRSETGVYDVSVLAWNGCAKDGGVIKASITQPVNVQNLFDQTDDQLAVVGGISGLVVALAILLILGGAIFTFSKSK